MKSIKFIPYPSVGDNMILIWLRREIKKQFGYECLIAPTDEKYRIQSPCYPGELWKCIFDIYTFNDVPLADGREDVTLHKWYYPDAEISIYHQFTKIASNVIGRDLDFSQTDILGFLKKDRSKTETVFDRFGLDDDCILINQPLANVNAARRYLPRYVYDRLMVLLRKMLPGKKLVRVGSLGSVYDGWHFDIDLWGQLDYSQYYHICSFLPQIGPTGGVVHFANGFSKEQSLVIYGGSEAHKWHWEDSMCFVDYRPSVSCECFAYETKDCSRHPSCFDTSYDLKLLEEKVEEFARRVLSA